MLVSSTNYVFSRQPAPWFNAPRGPADAAVQVFPAPEVTIAEISDDAAGPIMFDGFAGALQSCGDELVGAASDEECRARLRAITDPDNPVPLDQAVGTLRMIAENERLRAVVRRQLMGRGISSTAEADEAIRSADAAARSRELIRTKDIDEAMAVVRARYPEMDLLAGPTHATAERAAMEGGGTISERIFKYKRAPGNTTYDEFDRTALGIQCIIWVIKGEYEAFTACQPAAIKLTRSSFNQLQEYTLGVMRKGPEALDAMIVFMLAMDALTTYTIDNDLGKVKSMVDALAEKAGLSSADHDKVLYDLLTLHPEISPSFDRLPQHYKTVVMNGLRAVFSLPQLMQAEGIAGNLSGLKGLDEDSLEFLLLHHIYDLAGAAGAGMQKGTIIFKENTFRSAMAACAAVRGLRDGTLDEIQAYESLHSARAAALGLDFANPDDRVVERASCMFDIFSHEDAAEIKRAYEDSEVNTREILSREMIKNGINDGWAIMPYFSPGLLRNLRGTLTKLQADKPLYHAAKIAFQTMARAYRKARIAIGEKPGNGVAQVHLENLAKLAQTHPWELQKVEFDLIAKGDDFIVEARAIPVIMTSQLARKSFADIPGRRVVVVGIGGGSDGLQATQLADLLKKNGKEIAGVISVRKGPVSKLTLENHDGEVMPGVFKIRPETTGQIGTTGRFFEALMAQQQASYLFVEDESLGTDAERLRALLAHLENVDTLIAVDTGGDSLNSASHEDNASSTPDQDLRVLRAIGQLKGEVQHLISAIFAVGVDSPEDTHDLLIQAGAWVVGMSDADVSEFLALCEKWEVNRREDRFSKTLAALEQVLRGKSGIYADTGLPRSAMFQSRSGMIPDPYVFLAPWMRDPVFMDLTKHVALLDE